MVHLGQVEAPLLVLLAVLPPDLLRQLLDVQMLIDVVLLEKHHGVAQELFGIRGVGQRLQRA